jgi:hypothetical protein
MKSIKDKMTNFAGWLISIGTFLVGLPVLIATTVTGIQIPQTILGVVALIGVVCVGVGGLINSHYTGKNDDGTTKLPSQQTGGGK